jgi:hypothetical protein
MLPSKEREVTILATDAIKKLGYQIEDFSINCAYSQSPNSIDIWVGITFIKSGLNKSYKVIFNDESWLQELQEDLHNRKFDLLDFKEGDLVMIKESCRQRIKQNNESLDVCLKGIISEISSVPIVMGYPNHTPVKVTFTDNKELLMMAFELERV